MVNEHFPDKADANTTKQPTPLRAVPFCIGLLSYFEAARRLEKRSLLMVNEHFPGKADAKRANKTMQN